MPNSATVTTKIISVANIDQRYWSIFDRLFGNNAAGSIDCSSQVFQLKVDSTSSHAWCAANSQATRFKDDVVVPLRRNRCIGCTCFEWLPVLNGLIHNCTVWMSRKWAWSLRIRIIQAFSRRVVFVPKASEGDTKFETPAPTPREWMGFP